jgi:hypothetical protein
MLLTSITAQYGTLNQGDTLRTSPEFAKHLVEDCGAAKYVEAEQAQAPVTLLADVPAELVVKPKAPSRKTAKPEASTAPAGSDEQAPADSGTSADGGGAESVESTGIAAATGDDATQQ